MSLAQRWARKRLSNKMRLRGMETDLSQMLSQHKSIFTSAEFLRLVDTRMLLLKVLEYWKENNESSKNLYLSLKKEEK